MDQAGGHREKLACLSLILLAFALRLVLSDVRPIWYDEAFSILLSREGIPQILDGTAADIQPPLYYVLLHFWLLLGEQAFVVRFLSVLFSLASVALVYAVARHMLGHRVALIAMLMVAIFPLQVYYAQEARMYALLELSLLLYWYAFVKLDAEKTTREFALLLGISGAAALYSHSLALISFVVPDIYCLAKRNWILLRRVLIGQGLSILLLAPWVFVLAGQLVSIQRSYWIPPPGIAEVFQFLLALTTSQPLPDWLLPVALFATLATIVVLMLRIREASWRQPSDRLGIALAFWILPPLLMFIVSYLFRSVFIVRGVIISSAAFAILFAWMVARIPLRAVRIGVILALVILTQLALIFQLGYAGFPRSPFPSAVDYLRANLRNGDVIVHDNKLSYLPMRFYGADLPQEWIADPPTATSNTLAPMTMASLGIAPTRLEESSKSRVWFIIFRRAMEEAVSEGRIQANQAWLNEHFAVADRVHFNDLDIYLYQ